MNNKCESVSLGVPLALAGIGTVASLFINKKLHAVIGAFFIGFSVWHGFRHRNKLKTDVRNLVGYRKNIGNA